MEIAKNCVVTFNYNLHDDQDKEIEKSDEPMEYLHGYRNILPGLEQHLLDKATGDELSVTLSPAQAYGLRQQNSVQRVPIKHLVTKHKRYQPGMVVQVNAENGARDVVIIKVGKFNVDVDTNHPLAGKTLTFNIAIQEVRAATAEEIAHGHSHGVHGHSYH
jgi:FKBP-type peptidyl-prolyl cis-trans isomerase SlyD